MTLDQQHQDEDPKEVLQRTIRELITGAEDPALVQDNLLTITTRADVIRHGSEATFPLQTALGFSKKILTDNDFQKLKSALKSYLGNSWADALEKV